MPPLHTQRAAAAWFRQLSAADAIGRQLQVIHALDALCRSGTPLGFDCVAAIGYLDAELGPDRGQMIGQYVDSAGSGGAAVADRIWQAAYDISQAFIVAYRVLLEEALANRTDARWKREIPRLAARLIRFFGTDAKLRALKSERWIPAKWVELHRLYGRAVELGIETGAVGATAATGAVAATGRTIEREYITVLLTHLVNTGTLVPAQIEWALAQVNAWSGALHLDAAPGPGCAFAVDIGGRKGLVRCGAAESGTALRYLDTSPLAIEIERAIAALQGGGGDAADATALHQQRITVLEKLRNIMSPDTARAVSREPRAAISFDAEVRIGLARICQRLAPSDVRNVAFESATGATPRQLPATATATAAASISVVQDARTPPSPAEAEEAAAAAAAAAESAPAWRVQNRSNSGLRITAARALGEGLALGALVAVRPQTGGDWVLGVIRRIVRATTEKVDAGVYVIALQFAAVVLHAKRHAREDMGFVVDGVDVSTVGARFEGLYLPPPSRPKQPLAEKSLVIPASEYSKGRSIIVITPQTVYTVELRQVIERHFDWIWTTIEIVDGAART